MTREEAVKMLQATKLMLMDGANQPISDLYYALDMAIEALNEADTPQTELKGSKRLVKGSEKPNNYEDKPQTCYTCEYEWRDSTDEPCVYCYNGSKYKPKDEPQTDCPWK